MPGRKARELCPQLVFCQRPFRGLSAAGGCRDGSWADFTPLVERISIDEAFADVVGTEHLFGPPAEIAKAIRRRVRTELGLPISVGVARTKHLAKIASQVAKPDGLLVVDPLSELEFLHGLPVELMWGVGPATKARLAEIGVLTIGQLAKTSPRSLDRLLGRAASDKLAPGIAIRGKSRSIGAPNRRERNQRSARRPRRSASSGLYSVISPTVSAAASGPNPGLAGL
jgi:DNA polymerase-4